MVAFALSDMLGVGLTSGGGQKQKSSDDGESLVPLVARGSRRAQPMPQGMSALPLHDYLVEAEREANQSGGEDTAAHLREKLELKHIGCHLLLLQTTGACVAAATASVLAPNFLPLDGKSVVRTLLLSASVGGALLAKPLLVTEGSVQPVAALQRCFKSLRSALGFTLLCWTVEALVYTECAAAGAATATQPHHTIGPLRHGVLGAGMAIAALCGFFRAWYPRSVSDLHVLVALAAATTVAATPQTLDSSASPFTHPLSLAHAATRVCRIGLFALCFSATVLALLPSRPFSVEPLVVSTRAFSATLWILLCDPLGLFAGPFYLTLLCMRRAHSSNPQQQQQQPVVQGTPYSVVSLGHDDDDDDDAIADAPATKTCNLSEDRKRELMVRMGALT